MSTETSGANLPRHPQQDEWEPITSSRWWQNLPEEIGARRARRSERADRARQLREVDHLTEHPHIPSNLIETLQQGIDPDGPLAYTTVTIDGQRVHVAVSSKGTGIPEPDSQGVWGGLTSAYREISALPYCADAVVPLPQEIAAIGWTTAGGQTVNITPCKPRRLRGILGVALFPLAHTGDLTALSATSSAAAALVFGTSSLSPVPLPAEPAPDLRPKTGIAQRVPQAARTLRLEPVKARTQVRPSASAKVKVTAQTSASRPAVAPSATRAAVSAPVAPNISPAPEKHAVTPKPSETAPPAVPARPTGAGPETLLPSLPSLLRDGAQVPPSGFQ